MKNQKRKNLKKKASHHRMKVVRRMQRAKTTKIRKRSNTIMSIPAMKRQDHFRCLRHVDESIVSFQDLRNTIGNIPVEWYNDSEHIGYDWSAKKIGKPKRKAEIDEFLSKMDDPDYWWVLV